MPRYITLINWTDQGMRNLKEAPERFAAARSAVESAGGKLHEIYLTMGGYDLVVIGEAPSDELYASIILAVGAQGNIRTTTLKAFTEDEAVSIINRVPGG